jgi:hypothetical protein
MFGAAQLDTSRCPFEQSQTITVELQALVFKNPFEAGDQILANEEVVVWSGRG